MPSFLSLTLPRKINFIHFQRECEREEAMMGSLLKKTWNRWQGQRKRGRKGGSLGSSNGSKCVKVSRTCPSDGRSRKVGGCEKPDNLGCFFLFFIFSYLLFFNFFPSFFWFFFVLFFHYSPFSFDTMEAFPSLALGPPPGSCFNLIFWAFRGPCGVSLSFGVGVWLFAMFHVPIVEPYFPNMAWLDIKNIFSLLGSPSKWFSKFLCFLFGSPFALMVWV